MYTETILFAKEIYQNCNRVCPDNKKYVRSYLIINDIKKKIDSYIKKYYKFGYEKMTDKENVSYLIFNIQDILEIIQVPQKCDQDFDPCEMQEGIEDELWYCFINIVETDLDEVLSFFPKIIREKVINDYIESLF